MASPHNLASPASLQEFGSFFSSFKTSAFRLEMLESFSIPEEQAFLRRYQAGEKKPPKGFNSEWTDIIKNANKRGGSFNRVRIVRRPINDYLRFEVAWGYSVNVAAGEGIRIVDYSALSFKTAVPSLKDFWLFDDSSCFLMEYDSIGSFLGVSRLDERFVPAYVALKHELLGMSADIRASDLWKDLVR